MILLKSFVLQGTSVVDAWYADADPEARANLDARMKYLVQQPVAEWKRPMYAPLTKSKGVGEVRFKVRRVQYRPLGFFGPARMEFTFLMFSTHREHYEPRNAIAEAITRMGLVNADYKLAVAVKGRWNQ